MNSTVGSSYAAAGCVTEAAAAASTNEQFPAGLSVLVVDDDKILLKILEQMLRRLSYNVTICSQATVALNLLRERKGYFDVILSDVHMPDMDGFKLLELVGLEMDLPVIMMSADHRTSIVMKGIRHGACDYLIKPIREEELKNLWQHVVRKKCNGNKEHDHSGSLEDSDRHKRGSDEAEYTSVNDGTEGLQKAQKKRSISKDEDDGEFENDDSSSSKKPRVVWSVELHQQFVVAVNQLGIDKAVPKRILELMNVPGLTRENVASHLQKFRLYLKRLSGVAQQQSGITHPFCGPMDPIVKIGSSLGRFDIRALAASGQIPPQTLAALHAEFLGRPTGSLVLPTMDQPALLQASLQGSKCIPVEHGVAFGQPLLKCQSGISKHFPQSIMSYEDVSSEFGSWPSNSLGPVGPSVNVGELNTQTSNILMDLMQQQQQQHESVLPESSCSINVQPSCLVVPSRSSASFQMGNSSSLNQNSSFSSSSVIDYNLLSSQPNKSSLTIRQASDGDLKGTGVLNGYSGSGSISPSVSSCSVHTDNGINQQVRNSTITYTAARQLPQAVPNVCKVQGSYGAKSGEVLDRGQRKNIGFVGKGTSIPSRFAVDELESPTSNLNHGKIYAESDGYKVKEEPNLDFTSNSNVGLPVLQYFTPNDLMSVFSE